MGYPEWWDDHSRSRVQPQGISTRGRCRTGPNFNGGQSRPVPTYANAVNIVSSSSLERVNHVITGRDRDAVSGLSDEQWRSVVNLLNASRQNAAGQVKNGSNETLTCTISFSSWILDTSATHHMTENLNILTNLREIAPVMVILNDGRK